MTRESARSLGSYRLRVLLLSLALVGSLFIPTAVLAAPPTVTINQAAGQADPTDDSPINFTVVFSEAVTGFATGDVVFTGSTAGGTLTGTVTGGGTTYNVAVTGMTTSGSVIATVPAAAAENGTAEPNLASTSTDNTVTWDVTSPDVTINQAAGQADPTGSSPINFTVVFTESVTGFATGDVTLSGTAGGTLTGTVTGSGATYNVAVTGMTTAGTVIATIIAGVATDQVGNPNTASTSTDTTVTWSPGGPSVTINQAAGQADPTSTSPINFTVVFSASVTGFATGDVSLSGTAGATTAVVTGSGTTYNVAVTGMTSSGTVIATVPAGVAIDGGGLPNLASTSTDNTVTWDASPPSVTINQAASQADPTGTSPINFTVVFSESVTGFATGDVTITGTSGGTKTGTVTGSGATYNVAVTGMTTAGTVIATILAGVAVDAGGNPNLMSTSTDNTVTWSPGGPTVTINQAAGQADPTFTSPINFTVVFSSSVTGFATGDVVLSGTAGATTATVTGSGTTYNVAVSGMTTSGTVIATVPADVAVDGGGLPNAASTSTDNTVTWSPGPSVTINQAAGQPDPTGSSPINFTVVFSAAVTGFTDSDVTISGTAGGTKVATVTGSGTTYNVAVTGMTTAGTVIATIPAGVAIDASSRTNLASTSTDNVVAWSPGGPTVTINQAAGQADPTTVSPINFTVVFSAAVTGFATGDVVISGTAGGTKTATVTGSGTTYNVAVTGMTTAGTVIATVPAGVAVDASGRPNLASTSTDNTVTWSATATPITLTTSAPIPPGAHNPVILWGQGFTLTVQFGMPGGASRTFQLQGTRDRVTWTTITTLTTDANGRASLFYTPVTNLYYQAVFAGAADLAAANSNQVRTVVRQLALLRPTNEGTTRTINRNTSITFTTTVRPARPELAPATVSFYFYRFSSGAYRLVTKRNVVIDSAGRARTTFRFTSSGNWYVRSQANPTPYNANSVMTLEKYRVR